MIPTAGDGMERGSWEAPRGADWGTGRADSSDAYPPHAPLLLPVQRGGPNPVCAEREAREPCWGMEGGRAALRAICGEDRDGAVGG